LGQGAAIGSASLIIADDSLLNWKYLDWIPCRRNSKDPSCNFRTNLAGIFVHGKHISASEPVLSIWMHLEDIFKPMLIRPHQTLPSRGKTCDMVHGGRRFEVCLCDKWHHVMSKRAASEYSHFCLAAHIERVKGGAMDRFGAQLGFDKTRTADESGWLTYNTSDTMVVM